MPSKREHRKNGSVLPLSAPDQTRQRLPFFCPRQDRRLAGLVLLLIGAAYTCLRFSESIWLVALEIRSPYPRPPTLPDAKPCAFDGLTEDRSGYVTSSSNASHPLLALICQAERMWSEKVNRQSKTLQEAAQEYRRRYKRNPPKGFAQWYWFARKNSIKLVDEFDVINEWIEPFWALKASDIRNQLARYNRAIGNLTMTANFKNHRGTVTHNGMWSSGGRWYPDRVESFEKTIPKLGRFVDNVDVIFSQRDAPRFMLEWRTRARYLEAAHQGRTLTQDEIDDLPHDEAVTLEKACPPGSRMATGEGNPLTNQMAFLGLTPKRFTNACENPEWRHLHALFLPKNGPSVLQPHNTTFCRSDASWSYPADCLDHWMPPLPVISFSPVSISPEIPAPLIEQWYTFLEARPDGLPWESKPHNMMMWRGTVSGTSNQLGIPWQSGQRPRLHLLAHGANHLQTVRFLRNGLLTQERHESAELVRRYLDVGLTNRVYQCEPDCYQLEEWLAAHGAVHEEPFEAFYKYKYVMDVDGNGWSGRMRALMASHSLVMTASAFPAWYRDIIQPWYHYIPVRLDYADVFNILAFFSGDMDDQHGHDDLARKIASQGRTWAKQQWRPEDRDIYWIRLFLELARLAADDRASMDYVH